MVRDVSTVRDQIGRGGGRLVAHNVGGVVGDDLAGFIAYQLGADLHVHGVERVHQGIVEAVCRILTQDRAEDHLHHIEDALGIHAVNIVFVHPVIDGIGQARADQPERFDVFSHPNAHNGALGAVAARDHAVLIYIHQVRCGRRPNNVRTARDGVFALVFYRQLLLMVFLHMQEGFAAVAVFVHTHAVAVDLQIILIIRCGVAVRSKSCDRKRSKSQQNAQKNTEDALCSFVHAITFLLLSADAQNGHAGIVWKNPYLKYHYCAD